MGFHSRKAFVCTALLALTITLVAVFPLPAFTQGVPTSITYQGKITDGVGQPLPDGSNAMQFKLFSAETGGAQLWDSGAMNVGVKGGVFSVVLGASPTPPITNATLASDSVWLEVKVGVDPPLPRTKLSSAPFALRAAVAESVADNSITSAKIVDGSVDTPDLKDNAVTSAKIQDGAIQLVDLGQNGASANQVIKRNSANTAWIVADDADTEYWTESSGNVYRSSGNVGVGLTNPNRRLYVVENAAGLTYPLKIDNPHSTFGDAAGILFSTGGDGSHNLNTARGKGALVYEYKNTWNRGDFHFLQESGANANNPTLLNAALTIKNNGNVGIGTTDPGHKLHLSGTAGAMIRMDGEGAGMTGLNLTQSGTTHWSLFVRKWQSDNLIIRDDVAGTDTMVFPTGTGKVGVGTATPDAKFHVAGGSGKAVYGKASNATNLVGYGVYGEASYNDGKGVYGLNVTNNVYGYLGGSDRGAHGQSSATRYGYLGGNAYGAYAQYSDGQYGYLGGSDRGAYGRHIGGNAGSLGGSDYAVRADGDLVVTGAYRGSIGPNNGAPFPRPAYDSGWVMIADDAEITLDHNIGISAYQYLVDLQFMHSIYGIHNRGVGSDYYHYNDNYVRRGTHWHNLTTTSIKVTNEADSLTDQVRVRIWVCN